MSNSESQRQVERTVTSIRIDKELWRSLRIKAIAEERKVSDLLEEAVKKYMVA